MGRVWLAITFISVTFFTNVSFAHYQSRMLDVHFINKTDYACRAYSDINRGYWDIEPPRWIKKHSEADWRVEQEEYHGPDITVKFKCGHYSFSVRNQQNFCEFEGGDQTCSTFHVDKHLNVTNRETQHASYRFDKEGIAEIVVSPKV
ncbi:hypothetical protein [Candidatus Sororendozoicomonas aggregata]|uniref:hypothetical protein n=1 Tax=Candidatus Sororendozoicomonas aggregata TaxID=3073239 RepID=UPI002ED4909B